MKHIKFTYVDSITGISVASHPVENGLVFPAVDGLAFIWARESAYPTDVPEFFGTCSDAAFTMIDGVLDVLSQYDFENMQADEMRARPQPPDKWEAIKAERDRRTQDGGYYVAPHWYHSDQFSRIQQIGLVMLGASIPAGTMWKTLDNGMIEMTQALAGQIFGAAAASDIAIFAAAQTHKEAMEASNDPAGYDFSQGWPAVYAE